MKKIKDIKYYCSLFEKIRRDFKNGGAPHKPVLLISVIQAYQQRIFNTNQIFIVPELVGLFKSNWTTLVSTNHTCLFALPFYHLSSEPFWHLVPNPGCEAWVQSKSSMRSFSNLKTAIKYVTIDNELYNLLLDNNEAQTLLYFLLDKYFPKKRTKLDNTHTSYINDVKQQIVEEPYKDYQERILKIRNTLNLAEYEEEVFIRSNVFKKEIPKIYNNTCCISGLRIDAIDNISLVDACHIVPFSESYNDSITNGIALCPNLHRAFDRGLISINEKFNVLVNTNFIEPNSTSYNIKQFENKKIILPDNPKYYPALQSLIQHMNKWEFLK